MAPTLRPKARSYSTPTARSPSIRSTSSSATVTFTYTVSDGEATSLAPDDGHHRRARVRAAVRHGVHPRASTPAAACSFSLATYLADSVTITSVPCEGVLLVGGEAGRGRAGRSRTSDDDRVPGTRDRGLGAVLVQLDRVPTTMGQPPEATEYLVRGRRTGRARRLRVRGSAGHAAHVRGRHQQPGPRRWRHLRDRHRLPIPGTPVTNLQYDYDGGVWSFDTPPAGSNGTIVTFDVSVGFAAGLRRSVHRAA